nr:hypothetical protein [Candidatus Gracilibacteria bacterium]
MKQKFIYGVVMLVLGGSIFYFFNSNGQNKISTGVSNIATTTAISTTVTPDTTTLQTTGGNNMMKNNTTTRNMKGGQNWNSASGAS